MVKELAVSSSACNYIFEELQVCYKEHPVRRFTGFCSPVFRKLQRCIELQQNIRSEQNVKRSQERRKKFREASADNKSD